MDDRILAVQKMQDCIAANINKNISLIDLAEAAHFSPWYAARLFKELTGISPADYARRLRLSKSALRLRDEHITVTDSAYDAGFSSVEGYQRAFRREFGCNPKKYAEHAVPIPLFTAYGVKFRSCWKEEETAAEIRNVFIQVIDKPAHKAIVKRGIKAEEYWTYCNEVGCDVWGVLTSMKSLCKEPVCLWLPEKYRTPGTSKYVQGVETEIDDAAEVPEGFDIIDFPEQKYLMFQGEPFREEDYCEAIAAVEQAMDNYETSLIGYAWDDDSPRIQLEPRGERGYIEMRAVKSIQKSAGALSE
ncbi:MAG: AraC family transcriptional regulator [Erysipelotrichia bacterium]|nr:AraC family transcriptional regulator [Erysipelotrichia bacterium]